MVEAFATVILNTLLSGRSTLRYPASFDSVARITKSSTPRITPFPGFFTPLPRPVKGKEKESEESSCRLDECREWSSCFQRHSLWCPRQNRFSMLEELAPRQSMSVRRYKSRLSSLSCRKRLVPGFHAAQRRHASQYRELAEAPSQVVTDSVASPSTPTPLRRLEALTELHPKHFDLEEGWDAFMEVSDVNVPVHLLLTFADRLIYAAEGLYKGSGDPSIWGRRIAVILKKLGPRVAVLSPYDEWRLRLLARSMALIGDSQQGIYFAHLAGELQLVDRNESNMLRVYESLLLSISRYQGELAVLDFVAAEWSFMGPFLTRRSKEGPSKVKPLGSTLRKIAFQIAVEIDNPASVLKQKAEWDKERRELIGNFLIDVLCFFRIPRDALEVFHEMRKQHLHTPAGLQLALVRALTSDGAYGLANALFASVPKHESPMYYLSTGLHLHSHQANLEEAQLFYNDLQQHNSVSQHDLAMFLYAFSRQAKVHHKKNTHALFNQYFPKGPDGKRLNSPLVLHYNAVLYAHKDEGDIEGASYWLEDMSKSGLMPDVYVYAHVLNTLAVSDDLTGIQVVMDHMRSAGIQPNAVIYTVVITLLAHRKDVAAADAVFLQALREGIIPDRPMITSLMNAHVEAGSWKGVIRIFDYMQAFPFRRHIRLTIEVYNTLLKAYVLSGSPFRVVSQIVQRLEDSRIKPDNYTFALLIQSACDAGRMDIATDLFREMDRLASEHKERGLTVTVYVLTILLAGFLRKRDKVRAKGVYDEMRARGIQPSAVSFAAILRAYGNERTEESLAIAERFIKSLVSVPREEQVWNTPSHGRKSAVNHIYGPLLSAYSKEQKPKEVERLYHEMIRAGGVPSLGSLTVILDAYRRTFNIDAVLEVWPQILRLALSRWDSLPEAIKGDVSPTNLRGSIVSVPLSIYVDALSAAGRHSQVVATWHELRDHGFSFDSHNWNHLAVALVRGGQVERAFEVVEKVLLPTHQQSQQDIVLERDSNPSSPLSFEPSDFSKDKTGRRIFEPAIRHTKRRSVAARRAATKMSLVDINGDDNQHEHDFAHPLHILHQMSPSWGRWRPHKATLAVLLMAISRLGSGASVHPVLRSDTTEVYPPVQNEGFQAREMLNRIYHDYPDAIKAVFRHEVTERRRLGKRYDSKYNAK